MRIFRMTAVKHDRHVSLAILLKRHIVLRNVVAVAQSTSVIDIDSTVSNAASLSSRRRASTSSGASPTLSACTVMCCIHCTETTGCGPPYFAAQMFNVESLSSGEAGALQLEAATSAHDGFILRDRDEDHD